MKLGPLTLSSNAARLLTAQPKETDDQELVYRRLVEDNNGPTQGSVTPNLVKQSGNVEQAEGMMTTPCEPLNRLSMYLHRDLSDVKNNGGIQWSQRRVMRY